jgi:hypothetical protein
MLGAARIHPKPLEFVSCPSYDIFIHMDIPSPFLLRLQARFGNALLSMRSQSSQFEVDPGDALLSMRSGSQSSQSVPVEFQVDPGDAERGASPQRNQRRFGAIGEDVPQQHGAILEHSPSMLSPPMLNFDIRLCSPHIVAAAEVVLQPHVVVEQITRGSADNRDWTTIKQVQREVRSFLGAVSDDGMACKHRFAKAMLRVRGVASPAEPDSDIAIALRPLETSLAEAVGKEAHRLALAQHWLNKDGPRAEFLRGVEAQIEVPLTPRLRSRMLLTYHKIYGSAEMKGFQQQGLWPLLA